MEIALTTISLSLLGGALYAGHRRLLTLQIVLTALLCGLSYWLLLALTPQWGTEMPAWQRVAAPLSLTLAWFSAAAFLVLTFRWSRK